MTYPENENGWKSVTGVASLHFYNVQTKGRRASVSGEASITDGGLYLLIISNYRNTRVNGMWMWIFEWAIVNIFQLIHDGDWTFTGMDTNICSPTFCTRGLNLFTNVTAFTPVIAGNEAHLCATGKQTATLAKIIPSNVLKETISACDKSTYWWSWSSRTRIHPVFSSSAPWG